MANQRSATRVWITAIAVLAGSLMAAQPPIRVTPPTIEMGVFYDGARVRIEGLAEPGSRALVVVRGAGIKEVFNRKGRVGPIWVNAGKVEISAVPSLFLCFTPEPVAALLNRSEIDRCQLDETALKSQMRVEPPAMDQEIIREHYLKLKRQDGSLQVASGAVKMGPPAPAGEPFSVEFHWPKKAPPGRYEVRVYECRDGKVINQSSIPLEVLAVGFPARLARLAREHGSLYGAMAVVIAVLAGFTIDFLASRLIKRRARRRLPVVLEPAPEAAQPQETAAKAKAAAARAKAPGPGH
jgi:uncharacterized protein (TIGR02186 family)